MRIAMLGAGAVGGYFGARMASAGLDVSFLLRAESARSMRESGLRVRSPLGDVHLPEPNVIELGGSASPPEILFIACKAEHVRAASVSVRPQIGSETVVIPLQNGVDAPSILCEVLGPGPVLGGLSRIFAERVKVGEIDHSAILPSITCGELDGGVSDRAARVVEALEDVPGMEIDASADIWTAMWVKLTLVCSLGTVGAASRAPLGALLDVPESLRLLLAAGEEIAAVARASGAKIPEDFVAAQVDRWQGLPPETTASMHRDIERGDVSELDEQLGAVLRYARQRDVATPTLNALYAALLPGELRARRELQYDNVGPRADG